MAIEYWTKAAELGDVEAHCKLALLYQIGHGVEKDREKEIFHFEEAAIGGHPVARLNLGWHELGNNLNYERAVKHWIIAATQGQDESIKALMHLFKKGFVEKEDLAAALRAHKAAVDATKSPQREAAENIVASHPTAARERGEARSAASKTISHLLSSRSAPVGRGGRK